MVWENKDTESQALDELRNHFSLENIMDSDIMTSAPSSSDLNPGQFRMAYVSGALYLYTKRGNTMFRTQFTEV